MYPWPVTKYLFDYSCSCEGEKELRNWTLRNQMWRVLVSPRLTESRWREAEVLHARTDQCVQFLPLRATEQAESLLRDPLGGATRSLGTARPTSALPAQPPCPLHALPPQQWVIHGVGGWGRGGWWLRWGGILMKTRATEQRLSQLPGVLIVLHRDGHLRLRRRKHMDIGKSSEGDCSALSELRGIRLILYFFKNALD